MILWYLKNISSKFFLTFINSSHAPPKGLGNIQIAEIVTNNVVHWTRDKNNLWKGVIGYLGYQKCLFHTTTPWQTTYDYLLQEISAWARQRAKDLPCSGCLQDLPSGVQLLGLDLSTLVSSFQGQWPGSVRTTSTVKPCSFSYNIFKIKSMHIEIARDDQALDNTYVLFQMSSLIQTGLPQYIVSAKIQVKTLCMHLLQEKVSGI